MDAPSSAIARSPETREQRAIEAAFVAREPWAFEAAYDAYRKQLYGAAFFVLRERSESEDCVHDVLVRVWRNEHAYSPVRGALRAFLVVCVRNEALSRRRRDANRRRIEHTQLHAVNAVESAEEPNAERIDVQHALERLNEPQRQAVRLAYYDGLTHEEIAQRLAQPLGTVKSRLSNALRTLRGVLREGTNA
ncbi:MAG TPA: sigma-70 family RNA polymerase sigma factor [Candidatus Baltobacteraceae bacterium]|nr:sigma-70 family RNA polymerase sigma factor [Candidatus Baltobacteraceae bacterium]